MSDASSTLASALSDGSEPGAMVMMRALLSRRPSARDTSLFLFLWLMVGFASGTATLLGPVRWLTGFARGAGWSEGAENVLVIAVMGLYVTASFLMTLLLTRAVLRSERGAIRVGLPLLTVATACGAGWLWLTPELVNGLQPVEMTSVEQFTFGPYPEREQFARLREEGYTGVISLLSPTIPFEAVLLSREREAAREFGIELIQTPMLPWISGNEESLGKIRALAVVPGNRFYVHCYLGRDRVGMVRRLVQAVAPAAVASAAVDNQLRERRAFVRGSFERGAIYEVEPDVYLTPFPTEDEMLNYFVSGGAAHVVSLLDPDNEDDRQWIAAEESALATYEISYRNMPVSWKNFEPAAAVAAAEHVRQMPRPVLVHAFRSSGVASEAFRLAYASGLPPVPKGLFEQPLRGGQAEVVGVNVVVGPRPYGPEFGTFLVQRGIRGVVYVGDPRRPDAIEDRTVVRAETNLHWESFAPEAPELMETLARGGPWYVYGPGLGSVQRRIEERFAPQRAAIEARGNAELAAAAVGQ